MIIADPSADEWAKAPARCAADSGLSMETLDKVWSEFLWPNAERVMPDASPAKKAAACWKSCLEVLPLAHMSTPFVRWYVRHLAHAYCAAAKGRA